MMLELLPERYGKSNEIRNFQDALDPVISKRLDELETFLRQLNVDTADVGLYLWEKQYGIETDLTKSLYERRSRVISKMRGVGTTTKEMVRNVAESFVNGTVEIIEYPEEYRFDVRMVSIIGIPPNLEDLHEAIEEIKPAHLAFEIIMRFNTHSELRRFTCRQLSQFTHTHLREEAM